MVGWTYFFPKRHIGVKVYLICNTYYNIIVINLWINTDVPYNDLNKWIGSLFKWLKIRLNILKITLCIKKIM